MNEIKNISISRIIITVGVIVVLSAIFYFGSLYQKNIPIKNQNLRISNAPILETDVSNWQIHQSDKYGFSIKYPKNWEVIIASNSRINNGWIGDFLVNDELYKIILSSSRNTAYNGTALSVRVLPNSKNLNIRDYLRDQTNKNNIRAAECRSNNEEICGRIRSLGWNEDHPIILDGTDAYELVIYAPGIDVTKYIEVAKNGNIYELSYNTSNGDPDLEKYIPTFESIISTLKFFEPSKSVASEWKIYKNAEFGFEISLPPSMTTKVVNEEYARGVFIREGNNDIISIFIQDGGPKSLSQYESEFRNQLEGMGVFKTSSRSIINGQDFYVLEASGYCDGDDGCGLPSTNYITKKGSDLYNISFGIDKDMELNNTKKSIISSFKFLK